MQRILRYCVLLIPSASSWEVALLSSSRDPTGIRTSISCGHGTCRSSVLAVVLRRHSMVKMVHAELQDQQTLPVFCLQKQRLYCWCAAEQHNTLCVCLGWTGRGEEDYAWAFQPNAETFSNSPVVCFSQRLLRHPESLILTGLPSKPALESART